MNFQQISEDFRQKYEDTYVFVKYSPTKPKDLFYVSAVRHTSATTPPQLTLVNKRVGEISLTYTTECDVEFTWPNPGYFWHDGKYAVLFSRTSARQYRRGICRSNCAMVFPYAEYGLFLRIPVDETTINEAFTPVFVPLEDAENFIKTGQAISVPLSASLALGASPANDTKGNILWCFGKPIGIYSGAKLHLLENQFRQEVEDYLRDTNTNAQII